MNPVRIGLFDSGIGGLSILLQVRRILRGHDLIYFADQAHVPYGLRPLQDIRNFSEAITRFLLDQGAGLVVVACNTASAAALKHLRATFPEAPFVGMEPAVKPAAETTASGVVGVLATPATFQGELYASVVERFARGVRVINQTVPGLVEHIEAGDLEGPEPRQLLQGAIEPMVRQGVDTLVLACTHYPFAIPLISEIAGPGVRVIDPSPAIARQVLRILGESPASRGGRVRLVTSGDPRRMGALASRLTGEGWDVEGASWRSGAVVLDEG